MTLDHRVVRLALACGVVALLGTSACDDSSDSESDSGSAKDSGSDQTKDGGKEDAGDKEDASMDSGGGKEDASSSDAGGGSSDSGGSSDTGSGGDSGGDAGAGPSCSEYCSKIMTNCKDANAQYSMMNVCMAVCASFPQGALADTAGNTLGCRQYHAGAASGDPATHCNHAGITGGDKDPTDSAGGPCGEGCEAFCNAAATSCASTFASKSACMTECKMFPAGTKTFSTADTGGDTFNCRAYHLTAASTTPAPHCMHISKASSTCK